jgi:adenosyl cobinamide kinase/adenosyl cobinamide phosphate guanylyltransferase
MITLVLGGARSGKSEFAERLAVSSGHPVTYVATAVASDDADFQERIRLHRDRRPPDWLTEEPGTGLLDFLDHERSTATLLIDSLGTWVASSEDFAADGERLCRALTARPGLSIVVSEEVGLGVHPYTEAGGRFRDALGSLNQLVALVADDAYLVVAGRALRLERSA